MRWKLGFMVLFAVVIGYPGVAHADVAPPGEASAVAVEVGEVLAVADTEASAGPSGNEATANALEIGGEPPSKEFGGTQQGPGQSSGALVDTGDDPNFSLQITPWSADVDQRSAVAKAALARLRFAGAVSVDLLQSESQATYDGNSSTGASSSDGAVANVGGDEGLTIVVLHSEASSAANTSGAYLLAINGNEIGSSKDADGACLIELPDLVRITCLTASGGTAGDPTGFEAEVLGAVLGGDEGLMGRVVSAAGSGATTEVEAARADEPAPAPGGVLPFTGGSAVLGIAATALIAAGLAMMQLRRRWIPNA